MPSWITRLLSLQWEDIPAAACASCSLPINTALLPFESSCSPSSAALSSFTVIWAGIAWAAASGAQWLLNCLVGVLAFSADALPGASSVPGSKCKGWQVSQAYTLRACMSHVLILEPHLPHVAWLYTYLQQQPNCAVCEVAAACMLQLYLLCLLYCCRKMVCHTSIIQSQAHYSSEGLHSNCSLTTFLKQQVTASRSGQPAVCKAYGTESACWGAEVLAGDRKCMLGTQKACCGYKGMQGTAWNVTGHQVARPSCQHD